MAWMVGWLVNIGRKKVAWLLKLASYVVSQPVGRSVGRPASQPDFQPPKMAEEEPLLK